MQKYNVEISPRQSGKTERMIDELMEHYILERDVVIFSPSQRSSMYLKQKLRDMGVDTEAMTFISYADQFHRYVRQLNDPVGFYDEFDFIDWMDEEFMLPGYYYTSPKFTRTVEHLEKVFKGEVHDFLVELLDHTGGIYTSCTNIGRYFNSKNREAFQGCANSEEAISCELKGTFL